MRTLACVATVFCAVSFTTPDPKQEETGVFCDTQYAVVLYHTALVSGHTTALHAVNSLHNRDICSRVTLRYLKKELVTEAERAREVIIPSGLSVYRIIPESVQVGNRWTPFTRTMFIGHRDSNT